MSEPSPNLRDKVPPRFLAFVRRWQWKDAVIAVLALLVCSVSAYAFRAPLQQAFAKLKAGGGGEEVAVFDVVVDREGRQYADILFDHPLGEGKVGEVLDPAPAEIFPALGGSWKWQDTNALRFQPNGGFPVASEYKVTLEPEKILGENQVLTGDHELTIKTDPFLVEAVEVTEEPALEGKAKVIYRGEMRFNYAVNPEVLAPLVQVNDPDVAEPIEVTLETDWQNNVIGFRTAPIEKKKEERTVQLVISGELTPAEGNSPLGKEFVQDIQVGSADKLAVWGIEAIPGPRESSLKIRFSSPISAAVAEKYVTIEPKANVRFSAERNELMVTGELEPGTTYTVTVGQGMPATDDATLEEEYSEEVLLPDLDPTVDFQSQGMFLSASGNHTVAIESVNVPKVRMTVDRVFLNNLFFTFQYGGFFDYEYGYFG
ncbi:MAG TPA: hypothetical protein VJ725_25350, partial [Thermoanaerobaculia bacterium]|nr:hypothetical protein [Thermoanaerobaculia bacterium]